jgi:hypothetical protein
MQCQMMRPAKPAHQQRLVVVGVMHLGDVSADLTGFWLEFAALTIGIGVGAAGIFASLFDRHRMGLAPRPHVCGVASKAVSLATRPIVLNTAP